METRLSPKKHGIVKIYVNRDIDSKPWVRRLGGNYTTKTLFSLLRKHMARRLRRRIKEIGYEAYSDGYVFLCENKRIIFNYYWRGSWQLGEPWLVRHHQLYGDNQGYEQ